MAIEFDNLNFEMGECQYVKDVKNTAVTQSGEAAGDEDEDDFEEDDDEEADSGTGLRISNIAKLACAMRKVVNEKVAENKDEMVANSELKRITRGNEDKKYVWRPFNAIGYNFQLLCSGI